MLQRIQTIYLLAILVLMSVLMFVSLADVQINADFFKFDVSGLTTVGTESQLVYSTWSILALNVVIVAVALITIFLYKKRILQIRLCVFNGLLMVGYYALFAFFCWNLSKGLETGTIHITYKFVLAFPLICIILDYLAIRNIGADEALVRSLERLR
ncbi:MAG: DUF4293 domain-containing protein [Tannerellaceae bacterium]|nr:DUF4293 domain-containing protein [Tannerellaceae bacterium]